MFAHKHYNAAGKNRSQTFCVNTKITTGEGLNFLFGEQKTPASGRQAAPLCLPGSNPR